MRDFGRFVLLASMIMAVSFSAAAVDAQSTIVKMDDLSERSPGSQKSMVSGLDKVKSMTLLSALNANGNDIYGVNNLFARNVTVSYLTNVSEINSSLYLGGKPASFFYPNNYTVDWVSLYNYPSACSSSQTVTGLGDTLTCTAISIVSTQVSDFTTAVNALITAALTPYSTTAQTNSRYLNSTNTTPFYQRNEANSIFYNQSNPAGYISAEVDGIIGNEGNTTQQIYDVIAQTNATNYTLNTIAYANPTYLNRTNTTPFGQRNENNAQFVNVSQANSTCVEGSGNLVYGINSTGGVICRSDQQGTGGGTAPNIDFFGWLSNATHVFFNSTMWGGKTLFLNSTVNITNDTNIGGNLTVVGNITGSNISANIDCGRIKGGSDSDFCTDTGGGGGGSGVPTAWTVIANKTIVMNTTDLNVSIDRNYTAIQVKFYVNWTSGANSALGVRINNDSSTNYAANRITGVTLVAQNNANHVLLETTAVSRPRAGEMWIDCNTQSYSNQTAQGRIEMVSNVTTHPNNQMFAPVAISASFAYRNYTHGSCPKTIMIYGTTASTFIGAGSWIYVLGFNHTGAATP